MYCRSSAFAGRRGLAGRMRSWRSCSSDATAWCLAGRWGSRKARHYNAEIPDGDFLNGCFWHQHKGCKEASRSKTRRKFWADKLDGIVRRDQRNYRVLRKLGWRAMMVWECEVEWKQGRVLAGVERMAGLVPFDSTHRPVNVHRQAAAQNMATLQEG
jgi:hypothetical protein